MHGPNAEHKHIHISELHCLLKLMGDQQSIDIEIRITLFGLILCGFWETCSLGPI